jgi:hypothetical protein
MKCFAPLVEGLSTDRWKQRMGTNSYDFLQGVHSLHFRTFIKLCASFNMLDDFFASMSAEQRKSTLTEFVSHLEKYRYKTAELVNVPDALPSITNSANKKLICDVVQNEFKRVQKDSNGPGILILWFIRKHRSTISNRR